jgi:hypothetical protein
VLNFLVLVAVCYDQVKQCIDRHRA